MTEQTDLERLTAALTEARAAQRHINQAMGALARMASAANQKLDYLTRQILEAAACAERSRP